MKITAGKLKGLSFSDSPSARAHPMSERIKNALFNSIGEVNGLEVLDAYGGTGSLAFEAISRGALSVVVCENDRKVAQSLRKNIDGLNLSRQVKLVQKNVASYLKQTRFEFDLVIADPPFTDFRTAKLDTLAQSVKPGGLMVLSMPSKAKTPRLEGCEVIKTKAYGNATLCFFIRDRAQADL